MSKRTRRDAPKAGAWLAVVAAFLACVTAALYVLAAWLQLVTASWPR